MLKFGVIDRTLRFDRRAPEADREESAFTLELSQLHLYSQIDVRRTI